MKQLLEYLNDYHYNNLIINEVCNLIAEDEMVNESFKSSIVQKLAQAIYNAEKEYIDKLAKELDLSVSQIMRRALKLYKEKLADSKVTLD